MKKSWFIILLTLLLCGCSAVETFETLGSISHQSASTPAQAQVGLTLPEDAAEDVFQGEQETLYSCEDYSISLQTLDSGDLKSTIQSLSGYSPDKLTVVESASGTATRYDWVWTAVGEEGDMIGRGAVLDDGSYHYCLCVMASAEIAGSLTGEWNELFGSFHLESE